MSASRPHPLRLVLLALAACALLAAGCGGDDNSSGGGGGGGSVPADALKGANITVGSKEFTEQKILGEITVQALKAAGATVKDETGLAGSVGARKALTSGEIDLYWEYTGTAWLNYLKETKPIPDAQKQFQAVVDKDKKNKVTWVNPAPANNTYAFAIRESAANELGVKTISDLGKLAKERPDEATICAGTEFAARDDGLPGVEKAYGFKIPKGNVVRVDDGVVYTEVEKGDRCNFGSVFLTDGRIPANKLAVLEDDKKFFPQYNPALAVRTSVLKKNPKIEEVFKPIAEKLDNKALQDLNAQVDVDGLPEKDVAKQWLEDNGFLG